MFVSAPVEYEVLSSIPETGLCDGYGLCVGVYVGFFGFCGGFSREATL